MKKRYSPVYQESIVREYLLGYGKRRLSEMAMELSGMGERKRRKTFQNIMVLLEAGTLERHHTADGWRILAKGDK